LYENIDSLNEALRWLNRSYRICIDKFDLSELPEEGFDAFESLTARFARVTDVLLNKVYRSIFYLEEGASGSWLDTLLFMEKKGLISSHDEVRYLKELRNEIVHEYSQSDLKKLFEEVLKNCPLLVELAGQAIAYSEGLSEKLN
jgi:uncharacterized protein YutE (UPF0331/DUF86 family)